MDQAIGGGAFEVAAAFGISPDPPGALSAKPDSHALLTRFQSARARSVALAAPLSAEDQAAQSMPDASPTKWHLAHTTWFFETMVLAELPGYAPFDPSYGYLFNSYYEALGPRQPRMHRGLLTRPSADEVMAYRRHVDEALADLLPEGRLTGPIRARLVLGFAHEEQHQELILTDVLHLLAQNPLRPAYDLDAKPTPRSAARPLGWLELEGGVVEIGRRVEDGVAGPFAFDNEGPLHRSFLNPYALADRLVSNAEWLKFMAAGGYERPDFWLSEGWSTVVAQGWTSPLYWELEGGKWRVFGPAGLANLDPHAPVQHVSYFEADAYARWAGERLPTEAEWEHAACFCGSRLQDMFGSAWQWTASAYLPYPGFQPSAGALGEYNGKFMINQMVLRGSSWATAPEHSRPTYRNFFQPHQRWQISGVRLASDPVSKQPDGEDAV